ncbi:MAG: hypothetical protein IPK97_10175 [Ahniella sp.]|nr:hypothetical protein [Ahniella sp.]
MLEQIVETRWFCVALTCAGDVTQRVDEHHTIEDSALALGSLASGAGAKRGIRADMQLQLLLMDESLVDAALRPALSAAHLCLTASWGWSGTSVTCRRNWSRIFPVLRARPSVPTCTSRCAGEQLYHRS